MEAGAMKQMQNINKMLFKKTIYDSDNFLF